MLGRKGHYMVQYFFSILKNVGVKEPVTAVGKEAFLKYFRRGQSTTRIQRFRKEDRKRKRQSITINSTPGFEKLTTALTVSTTHVVSRNDCPA